MSYIYTLLVYLSINVAAVSAQGVESRLRGTWTLHIHNPDIGYIESVMTFDGTDGRLEAHSYDGGAAVVASWLERAWMNLTSSVFEAGALLHIRTITPREPRAGKLPFAAVFSSAAGSILLEAEVRNDSIVGTFIRANRPAGWISAVKKPTLMPLCNYPAIVQTALDTLQRKFYDPTWAVAENETYSRFERDIRELGAESREDAEFVMSFYRIKSKLPFSHCYLYRQPISIDAALSAMQVQEVPAVTLDTTHTGVHILYITSFSGDGAELDSVMNIVHKGRPAKLVIDLRGNQGGNISAVQLARHLVPGKRLVGTFLTRSWTAHNVPSLTSPSSTEEYDVLPELETGSYDTLMYHLHNGPGVRLMITPGERVYKGQIYVLTDTRTASTCEPLTYCLKEWKLATIIGRPTAGAMLSAEQFPIGQGWQIFVPTADFRTFDGKRLDMVGVIPHIEMDARNALEYVLEQP